MADAPDRVVLFRRVGSNEWHLGVKGETMSWGNAEGKAYILEDTLGVNKEEKANEQA